MCACLCVKRVHIKGAISPAGLANYRVLQAVMGGEGKGMRKRGEKGLHLKVTNKAKHRGLSCTQNTPVQDVCGHTVTT